MKGIGTSSLPSHCSDKTDICSSSFAICCTSLLFFISSSLSCVCTWLACSCRRCQKDLWHLYTSIFFHTDHTWTICTCTCRSSSVKAISVMSDGGCSPQMSSPPSSSPLRCSGLDRGARRDRRLYGLVGVVRIWGKWWFAWKEGKVV